MKSNIHSCKMENSFEKKIECPDCKLKGIIELKISNDGALFSPLDILSCPKCGKLDV